MKTIRLITPLLGSIALLVPAHAVDVIKLNNTTALNAGGSWTGGAVPGANDVAVWDATVMAPNNSLIGGSLSWQGIRIGGVLGTRNNGTNFININDAATFKVLTLGTAGIDMSAALQALRVQSNVLLGASQTWNVANANTATSPTGLNKNEDLAFTALAAGVTFDGGGFTVTKQGAGTVAFASGITLNNANFNVNAGILQIQSGGSRVTTLNAASSITVNNTGILSMATESGAGGIAINSAAALTFAAGSTLNLQLNQNLSLNQTGNVAVSGTTTWNVTTSTASPAFTTALATMSGNITGSGAINYNNSQAQTGSFLRLTGDNSGYSGTLTLNGTTNNRSLRLAGANAGSTAATWAVNAGNTLQVDGVSVQLGTLNGAGTVTNSHATAAATANVGAGAFSGAITNGAGTGGMGLTKFGAGTLTLSGANTYTGVTNVNGGTLTLTAPLTTTSRFNVGAAGTLDVTGLGGGMVLGAAQTLSGTGNVTGAVITANNATIAPGDQAGAGTLTVANLTLGQVAGDITNINMVTTPGAGKINTSSLNLAGGAGSARFFFPVGGISVGTHVLVDYDGAIGGAGYAGFTIGGIQPRVIGGLADNTVNSSVDLQISAIDYPRWNGNVNGDWDVDDGTPTGTANWREVISGNTTRFLQGGAGTDSALFDDNATGTTNVNLTTSHTPLAVTVDNTAKNYTFAGTGKISGATGLVKNGTGNLTIANTTANDYTGGTIINAGTLTLGDGVTAGAGVLPLAITNNGTLVFNRPDDHALANIITGTGIIRKEQANTINVPVAATLGNPIELNAGTVRFDAGGNLSGPISGGGALTAAGGTLQLSGAAANTNTGLTTVSNGVLQLNKTAGISAVGGDITITGAGQLSLLAGEQIPNTATITLLGTNTNSVASGTIPAETVANIIVNSSTAGTGGGQVIMRNGMNVTGTGTVNSGILGIASGHTATVNTINFTSAPGSNGILRIAGGSAASVLNVGAGGITASGGDIQVKFNGNNQDATLNLGGDFTATGNVTITNAGYTGASLNIINLLGTRTFDIAAGTTTTVAPDIGGTGDLIKDGDGILSLETSNASTHIGATTVAGGTLLVKGIINGTSALNIAGGTLGGNGGITLATGGDVSIGAGGILSPGTSVGTLTLNLSGGGTLDLSSALAGNSDTLNFELDAPLASDKIIVTGGTTLIGSGNLEFNDFVFTPLGGFLDNNTYTLIDGDTPIIGTLGPDVNGTVGGFTARLEFADGGKDLVLFVPEPGSATLLLGGLALLARRRRK